MSTSHSPSPGNLPVVVLSSDPERALAWQEVLALSGFPVACSDQAHADVYRTGAAAILICDVHSAQSSTARMIRELRERGNTSYLLALTPPGDVAALTACIDAGADAVAARCCTPRELLARVRALVRRKPREHQSGAWRIGSLTIDAAAHAVTKGPVRIALSPHEYAVLLTLARCTGCIVSRAELLTAVWGRAAASESHCVESTISALRKKIEDDPSHPASIITVRGAGYFIQA